MKIKNEKKVLGLFTGDNDIRDWMHTPFRNPDDKGNIWSTDGRVLLIVDPSLVRCKYPDYKMKICSQAEDEYTIVDYAYRIKSLRKALDKLPHKEEIEIRYGDWKDCDECNCTGEVEWSYTDSNGHDYYEYHDCPKCEGLGKCNEEIEFNTGRMILDESLVNISGVLFNSKLIERICDAMDLLGVTEIRHTIKSRYGVNKFVIMDGISMALMPMINPDELPKVRVLHI